MGSELKPFTDIDIDAMSKSTVVEVKMLKSMLLFYCRKYHGKRRGLCSTCSGLLEYTILNVSKCPYRKKKPSCRKCPVNCFEEGYREEVRRVMKSSGWKVLLLHPLLTYSYYKRLTDI